MISSVIKYFLYLGFKVLSPEVVQERNEYLRRELGALPLRGVSLDAKYLPSSSPQRTGNIVVICLNTTYQDHHPRHYLPFLENGADVVLWNPTDITPKTYEAELASLLRSLHQEHPASAIALKTYCAGSDPALSAAASLSFPVHLIIDRGHGDTSALVGFLTILAKIPFIHEILKTTFSCNGAEKIHTLRGRLLFMTPASGDQIMDYRGGNLTRDLARRVNEVAKIIPGDHWAKWGKTAYTHALQFLHTLNIVSQVALNETTYPDPEPPSYFKQNCLPYLIKSPCA